MSPDGPTDPAADVLTAGAAQLGCPLTPEQIARLHAYQGLLLRWNRVYNLTAIRDEAGVATLHLLDSLAAVAPLDRWAADPARPAATAPATPGRTGDRGLTILDVGSGGGLPGVVLAIARPRWQVTCLDAVAKKSRFVHQAALELGLPNLNAQHARVEQAPAAGADVVVSRAFASLPDFTALTRHHLRPSGVWLAMKGRAPGDEIAALPPTVDVFHVEPLQVPGLDAQRCLVWMRPRD